MKVAIVHYWFTRWRGGERVVRELLQLYPQADVYAHVADAALLRERLPGVQVRESFIARLPFGRRFYRCYLHLMPKALEDLDLQSYDLIISSESGPAKGIIKRPDAIHVCYCHSPMRYLWDQAPLYRRQLGWLQGGLLSWIAPSLRVWDVTSAVRVDQFIANSAFVARRIAAYYGRASVIINPPVELGDELPQRSANAAAPYYLLAGELVGYKRADIAVAAANRLRHRLVIVGEGEQRRRLQALAGDTVEFVGRVSDAEFRRWLAGARALVFPGLEDFGMVPVEAMASGTPLIAYARGGAREYLLDGVNGVGFEQQDCDGLVDAILRFEAIEHAIAPADVRATALRFSAHRFRQQITELVAELQRRNSVEEERACAGRAAAAGRGT